MYGHACGHANEPLLLLPAVVQIAPQPAESALLAADRAAAPVAPLAPGWESHPCCRREGRAVRKDMYMNTDMCRGLVLDAGVTPG